jgi:hypothetical protein
MAVIDRKFDRKILIMRSRSRSRFFQFIAIAVAISEKWPRSWSRDQTIAIVTTLKGGQKLMALTLAIHLGSWVSVAGVYSYGGGDCVGGAGDPGAAS